MGSAARPPAHMSPHCRTADATCPTPMADCRKAGINQRLSTFLPPTRPQRWEKEGAFARLNFHAFNGGTYMRKLMIAAAVAALATPAFAQTQTAVGNSQGLIPVQV